MSSTPKHLVMYEAFGWEPPQFAHVGLLVDQNGQKLSKRNMDIDISSFRNKMGILPEALNNYLALQGWHVQQREGKDFMTMKDLIPNVGYAVFSSAMLTGGSSTRSSQLATRL